MHIETGECEPSSSPSLSYGVVVVAAWGVDASIVVGSALVITAELKTGTVIATFVGLGSGVSRMRLCSSHGIVAGTCWTLGVAVDAAVDVIAFAADADVLAL